MYDVYGEWRVRQTCAAEKKGPQDLESSDRVKLNVETPDNEIQEFIRWAIEKQLHIKLPRPGQPEVRVGIGTTTLGRILKDDAELQLEIPEKVSKAAGHSFLLAKLYIDKILLQTNDEEVYEALSDLPEGLHNIYEDIFRTRVRGNDNEKLAGVGVKVLSWMSYSQERLTLGQLQQAIAVRPGDTSLRPRIYRDEQTILEACAGFLIFEFDKTSDFHHLTAHDYFEERRKDLFPQAETEIALANLTYLSYDEFENPCEGAHAEEELKKRLEKYPFLTYAARNWGFHVRALDLEDATNAVFRKKAISILVDQKRLDALTQADSVTWDTPYVSGLQMCGRFGLTALIPELTRKGLPIDGVGDAYRQTGLMYACRWQHPEAVTEFLQNKADVNCMSTRGTTALYEAIVNKSEAMANNSEAELLRLLLNAGADVNAALSFERGRSAIIIAVSHGNITAVNALLERPEIKVNQSDAIGWTALITAACEGWGDYIAALLKHEDIDVDLAALDGRTALLHAAEQGDKTIVTALLRKGANPDIRTKVGSRNAVITAVQFHNVEATKILLDEYPALIYSADDRGRGLLHYACSENGQDAEDDEILPEILDMLVSKGLDIDAQSTTRKQTPLHEACRTGNLPAVEFL